ncbi:DUF6717 family protein [Limnoglobus roseus]|uniref:Uncharacterized protein n=1 Tax=Limnoglobus roseus TaxID=2598579 RepID=A0A5C1AEX8_9BACT|nr:DUF6717 family protein [Limnoglobus roseus]QEL17871.1 hypothetical protein PX52LOC_04882 [Limnoglobus roseus]
MKTLTLYPYLIGHTWVFDDVRTNLKEEAFVLGSSEVLTRLVGEKRIPDAGRGFTLHFADEPFVGFDAELRWLRSDDAQVVPGQDGSASQVAGNWYGGVVAGERMEGWLCPALGLYFGAAPARIFVRAESLPPGVDPVWHVNVTDLPPRRFVSAVE